MSSESYDTGAVLGLILMEGSVESERDASGAASALIACVSGTGISLSESAEHRSRLDYLLKRDYNGALILH